MALLTEKLSFSFRITVAENFVYAHMSFFLSSLLGEPVAVGHYFQIATPLVKSDVLFPFPGVVYAFESNGVLFSLLQDRQFDD